MIRARLLSLGFLLALAPTTASAGLTPDQWRRDLRTLDSALTAIHRDPDRRIPREGFAREVAELDSRIPRLAPHEVILGMVRLAALLGDGHTRLALPEGPGWATDYAHAPTALPRDSSLVFHHLPLRLWSYEDGLGVEAVLAGSEALLGARLLAIEGVPAESALARMRPFVSIDNDEGLRFLGAARLSCLEVLHAAGIARSTSGATLELRTRDGRTQRVTLAARATTSPPAWRTIASLAPAARLADRHPQAPWWSARIEGHDALFVQVNQVADTDSVRFVEFADRLARTIERERPGRVVVDLRANTGGDNQLLRPLVLALARAPSVNRHGGLYVLTGRRTFSAAQMLVSQLEQWTEALFAGEPTGTTPSHFGDNRRVVLPHSGLTLRIATVYWRDWTGNESRRATMPDLPAPLRLADDLAGRDPALDAALGFRPAAGLVAQVGQLLEAGGQNAAVRRVFRAAWDPAFTRAQVDSAIARVQSR